VSSPLDSTNSAESAPLAPNLPIIPRWTSGSGLRAFAAGVRRELRESARPAKPGAPLASNWGGQISNLDDREQEL